jgi:S1-C subfamily serine protease
LYTHDNRGLRVLGIVPGSPAEEIGIVPGEIISRVNGIRVLTKLQLHEAFRQNSVYCKLEVINLEGELKFLKRAIFEGDLHQLGIILAPDDATSVYVTEGQLPLRGMLGKTEGVARLR